MSICIIFDGYDVYLESCFYESLRNDDKMLLIYEVNYL